MNDRKLIDARAAASRLGLAVQTLARWRVEGGGPPFLKLGGSVRYDLSDLDAWLDAQRRRHTAEAGSGPAAA
jgi:predicted DNA-binding transcriptional regulator AlpA